MTGLPSVHRTHCQNCGEPLTGPFCARCGQHDVDYHRSIGPMVEDALEGFFHLDGMFFRSVRYLFTRPGFLTQEFNAGRRVRYANPVRFYIFASFLFFVVRAVTTHPPTPAEVAAARIEAEKSEKDAMEAIKEAEQESPELKKAMESRSAKQAAEAAPSPSVEGTSVAPSKGPRSRSAFIRRELMLDSKLDQKAVSQEFVHLLPTMLFFCMPVLALVLKLVYLRSGRFYVEHLIFALHVQAFVFLSLLVVMAGEFLGRLVGDSTETWAGSILALGMTWLIYRAFRTVYGQGRTMTALKLVLVGGAYGTILLIGFLVIGIASAYMVSRNA